VADAHDVASREVPVSSPDASGADGSSPDAADARGEEAASPDAAAADGPGAPDAPIVADAVAPDTRPDATGDAGDPTACDDRFTGALFCDGFESGALDRWSSAESSPGWSTVVAATTLPYRGGYYLKGDTSWSGFQARVSKTLPPVTNRDLYLRFYTSVSAPANTVNVPSINVVEIGGAGGASVRLDASGRMIYAPNTVVVDGKGYSSTAKPPLYRWNCVQVHVVVDDVNGAVELSVNGMQMAAPTGLDTSPTGGITRLDIGVNSAQVPCTVEVDEVILSTTPLPCD
jgi:hypothetical protein